MALTDQQVRDLAMLARLELAEQELGKVREKLGRILEFVERLSELDTEDVEPMTTALDVDNRWRGDEPLSGLPREEALQNSPANDGECFLVPPVLGNTPAK